ncbi:dehydrodolichyl diphosphate synthetase [Phaffia rhodozyma]|uniref:Alkyl transferase n=1 Tax=Phaffia rhodozyma TaxID=264483 RepID=A0A0F7SYG2_PHARH|nr:dehydrodolichyl diphosphate synthetase [Phaffia rhodozyma]
MDGNRRFARSRGRPVMDGHLKGFDSLKNILELCLRLDIQCVSIYTFSIDNFNRPQEEVGALMNLARGRFRELAEKGELLDRYSVRVNILGKTSLLPTDVQQSVKEMQDLTRHNSKAILNVWEQPAIGYPNQDVWGQPTFRFPPVADGQGTSPMAERTLVQQRPSGKSFKENFLT